MNRVVTVREHQALAESGLADEDLAELRGFARKVLKRADGEVAATNYVGVVTTRRGTVLEILPKIDLDDPSGDSVERTRRVFLEEERTRRVFLEMLRSWRRLPDPLPHSDIRSVSRFPMLEVFVRHFLRVLARLTRHGLARRYVSVEENLRYLRGRIVFAPHLRENVSNRARFYTSHDELSVNRPANRLIHTALNRLAPRIRYDTNRQLLREALAAFSDVPLSADASADWHAHRIDRSMNHYRPVMQWVGLFLFNRGLATFAGANRYVSLLFPMEQVFEDFLVDSFRRHQQQYVVTSQGPRREMARIDGARVFRTRPDIVLQAGGGVRFVLDAKWKRINAEDLKHGIQRADVYQLYAYAKCYGCGTVVLIYPRNESFRRVLRYRFFDGVNLLALPFDVSEPRSSVIRTMGELEKAADTTRCDSVRLPRPRTPTPGTGSGR